MNATRYTAADLRGMTLTELAEIGKSCNPPLFFDKHHNKRTRAKRILDAYAASDLASDSTDPKSPPFTPADSPHNPGARNPEFERLIDSRPLEGEEAADNASQRGGSRPGAGRPEGMTDEIALYNRLSKQPHPGVKMAVEKLFDRWAAKVGTKTIVPDKEKMVALALTWTHVYEISPVRGLLPPWVVVLLSCVWMTYVVMDDTATAAREFRERKRLGIPDVKDAVVTTFEPKGS